MFTALLTSLFTNFSPYLYMRLKSYIGVISNTVNPPDASAPLYSKYHPLSLLSLYTRQYLMKTEISIKISHINSSSLCCFGSIFSPFFKRLCICSLSPKYFTIFSLSYLLYLICIILSYCLNLFWHPIFVYYL